MSTFLTENKVLPGSYVKFINAVKGSATLSERGCAALLLPTEWNAGEMVRLTHDTLSDSLALLGYAPTSDEMRPVREMLTSCAEVLVCTIGGGTPARCAVASAKRSGALGNRITIRVSQNPDWTASNLKMDVVTSVAGVIVDRQIGVNASVLAGEIEDNAFVTFDPMAVLDRPTVYTLSGGMSTTITVADYQSGLDRLESEVFHALAYGGEDAGVRALFSNYTRRMREECGAMFQCVLSGERANYRGVVNAYDRASVYWIAGALAGCGVNESLTHKVYNGECSLTCPDTQSEKIATLEAHTFAFHNVGGEIRVLQDCNSEDDALFGQNQAVRVLDQIANDVASLFCSRYLGKIQNNRAGRMSFWNDVVSLLSKLYELGAIDDFSAEDVSVEAGDEKTAVRVTAKICPVCGMEKLYLTVTVV